jgi:hypothetical protein
VEGDVHRSMFIRDKDSTLAPGYLETTALESNPFCHMFINKVLLAPSHTHLLSLTVFTLQKQC